MCSASAVFGQVLKDSAHVIFLGSCAAMSRSCFAFHHHAEGSQVWISLCSDCCLEFTGISYRATNAFQMQAAKLVTVDVPNHEILKYTSLIGSCGTM